MTAEEGAEAQLEKMGIARESVRHVLQSHLHLDHTGAMGRFPNATHVVQRSEYEYAFTPNWFAAGGYIHKDFDKPGLKWQFLNGELTDGYDLYGDGVIRMIFTSGHAPGHQCADERIARDSAGMQRDHRPRVDPLLRAA